MTLLDRYVMIAALRAQLLVAAILTAMFTLLDFVEQLATVGQGTYRPVDALVFVLLNAPHRLVQVAPVSMLLGTLLALGNLNRTAELTAIRSLGRSEARIVGSIVVLAIPVSIAMFLLAEFVVPPAQLRAQEQRAVAVSSLRADESFWAQAHGHYLNIETFAGRTALRGVSVFSFDADGALSRYIHGDRAAIEPDGTWLLTGVVVKHVAGGMLQTEQPRTLSWTPFVTPQQMQLLRLPVDSMPPVALFRYVRYLRHHDEPAGRYDQALWTKISLPLSIVSMIILTVPFTFGSNRARTAGYQLVMGAGVGIVFTLAQQITGYLGVLLDLGPATSALAPSLVLMGVAVHLYRRTV